MSAADNRTARARRNRRVLLGVVAGVIGMNGLAYAMVPAYRAFCQQFGFAGTPLVEATAPAPDAVIERPITVRFDSNTEPALPWRFKPVQRQIDLKVGETGLAFFEAVNRHETPVSGTATFNVTPLKAAPYFVKIECFCFTEQTLEPGQAVQMPVTFYVDPAIAEDRHMDDVTAITLSYTFFRDHDAEAARKSAEVASDTDTKVN
ncbi:MAG: cytochrome c oxidase assembly protein [Alphaproteobacteria bacterium]|nr:cytochrome c oxidase assembly protein [Alphaproteobacteria bacterium]